jgi:hypothetical protein
VREGDILSGSLERANISHWTMKRVQKLGDSEHYVRHRQNRLDSSQYLYFRGISHKLSVDSDISKRGTLTYEFFRRLRMVSNYVK